jgi:4-amino-4-deoxy-L-arabinose transferase-like glycosyltransferase
MKYLLKHRKENIFLIIILVISFTLRLIFSLGNDKALFVDILSYSSFGEQILHKGIYFIEAYNAPGYPVFLSIIYFVFGKSFIAVYVLQSLLGTLTTYLIYLIGYKMYGKSAGLCAACLSLLYWPLWLYSGILMSETLFIFLMLSGVYFFLLLLESEKTYIFVLCAASFSLSTLTRSINMVMIVLIPLLFIFIKRKLNKRIIFKFILFIIAFSVIIAPWTIRNYMKYDRFVAIDTLMGLNLLAGNNDKSEGTYRILDKAETKRLIKKYTGKDVSVIEEKSHPIMDKYMKEAAINCIKSDPERFIKNTLTRADYFILFDFKELDWVPQKYMDEHFLFNKKSFQKIQYVSNIIFYIIGLIGILAVLLKKKRYEVILLFVPYYFFATVVFYVSQRYRLPIMPFLSISGGYLISLIVAFVLKRDGMKVLKKT